MERSAFCALIKHIFKTDLPKEKISCAKDFISLHMQTLALKCSPEIYDEKMKYVGYIKSVYMIETGFNQNRN